MSSRDKPCYHDWKHKETLVEHRPDIGDRTTYLYVCIHCGEPRAIEMAGTKAKRRASG